MWIKEHNAITQYIPKDGKWHDIQIINNFIYVDGALKNPSADHFADFKIFDRKLTKKEIKLLAEEK